MAQIQVTKKIYDDFFRNRQDPTQNLSEFLLEGQGLLESTPTKCDIPIINELIAELQETIDDDFNDVEDDELDTEQKILFPLPEHPIKHDEPSLKEILQELAYKDFQARLKKREECEETKSCLEETKEVEQNYSNETEEEDEEEVVLKRPEDYLAILLKKNKYSHIIISLYKDDFYSISVKNCDEVEEMQIMEPYSEGCDIFLSSMENGVFPESLVDFLFHDIQQNLFYDGYLIVEKRVFKKSHHCITEVLPGLISSKLGQNFYSSKYYLLEAPVHYENDSSNNGYGWKENFCPGLDKVTVQCTYAEKECTNFPGKVVSPFIDDPTEHYSFDKFLEKNEDIVRNVSKEDKFLLEEMFKALDDYDRKNKNRADICNNENGEKKKLPKCEMERFLAERSVPELNGEFENFSPIETFVFKHTSSSRKLNSEDMFITDYLYISIINKEFLIADQLKFDKSNFITVKDRKNLDEVVHSKYHCLWNKSGQMKVYHENMDDPLKLILSIMSNETKSKQQDDIEKMLSSVWAKEKVEEKKVYVPGESSFLDTYLSAVYKWRDKKEIFINFKPNGTKSDKNISTDTAKKSDLESDVSEGSGNVTVLEKSENIPTDPLNMWEIDSDFIGCEEKSKLAINVTEDLNLDKTLYQNCIKEPSPSKILPSSEQMPLLFEPTIGDPICDESDPDEPFADIVSTDVSSLKELYDSIWGSSSLWNSVSNPEEKENQGYSFTNDML